MVARNPAEWDNCQWDFFRWDVKNSIFDDAVKAFENAHGTNSCNVTRRKLSLGARDSTTGWRAKSWTEDTVKGIFTPRGSTPTALKAGTYVRSDALLRTCAGFSEGDEVQTNDGKYWEVKAVREFWFAQNNFSHRELDLTYLPLHI